MVTFMEDVLMDDAGVVGVTGEDPAGVEGVSEVVDPLDGCITDDIALPPSPSPSPRLP